MRGVACFAGFARNLRGQELVAADGVVQDKIRRIGRPIDARRYSSGHDMFLSGALPDREIDGIRRHRALRHLRLGHGREAAAAVQIRRDDAGQVVAGKLQLAEGNDGDRRGALDPPGDIDGQFGMARAG